MVVLTRQPGVLLGFISLFGCHSLYFFFPGFFSLIGNLEHNNLSFTVKSLTAGAEEVETRVSSSVTRKARAAARRKLVVKLVCACVCTVWKPPSSCSIFWRNFHSPQRSRGILAKWGVDGKPLLSEARAETGGQREAPFQESQMYCVFGSGKLIPKGLCSHHPHPSFKKQTVDTVSNSRQMPSISKSIISRHRLVDVERS